MRVFGMPISRTGRRKSENKFHAFRIRTHTQTEHIYDIYYNISHSCLAWVMGFGIPQECDSDSANGSKFAPMKSGQPQWIYAHEAVISSLPVSLC